jgi:hypothetical protein
MEYNKQWVHLFIFTVIYVIKWVQRDAIEEKLSIPSSLIEKTGAACDRMDQYELEPNSHGIQQAVGSSLHVIYVCKWVLYFVVLIGGIFR